MLSLVLIDDEPAQRAGMRTLIDWEAQGYRIVGEAGDGLSGLRLLETLAPNIALVDMKMPVMNGVELIRQARERGLSTRFIVLSGYGDFEYTKQAILLSVDAYLLKPVDEDELAETLKMLRGRVEEERTRADYLQRGRKDRLRALVRTLVETPGMGSAMAPDDIACAGKAIGAPPYAVITLCGLPADARRRRDEMELVDFFSEPQVFPYFGDEVTLVLSGVEKAALAARVKRLHGRLHLKMGISAFFAVGKTVHSLRDLNLSWQSAKSLLLSAFLFRDRPLLLADTMPHVASATKRPNDVAAAIEQIGGAVRILDAERIDQGLAALSDIFLEGAYSAEEIKSICSGLITELLTAARTQQEDAPLPEREAVLLAVFSAENLHRLMQILQEQLKRIAAAMNDATADTVVKRMVSYVDKYYAERLTLERLGVIFGYNGAYLGRIFHRFTGMHFPDYLDKKRIDEAKILLAGGCRIYQAAEKVGFRNQDYFSVRFKRREGISPKEYVSNCTDS